jgi:glutathione S-transferase
VVAPLAYAEEAKVPLEDYPDIRRWRTRLMALPAWRETTPVTRAAA